VVAEIQYGLAAFTHGNAANQANRCPILQLSGAWMRNLYPLDLSVSTSGMLTAQRCATRLQV